MALERDVKVWVKESAIERMARFNGIPRSTFGGVTLTIEKKRSDGWVYAKSGSAGGWFSPQDVYEVG